MSVRANVSTLLAGWLLVTASHPVSADPIPLPPDFARRAMQHVEALVALGPRPAGREGEAQAARYVADQLRQMGLAVVVEPFSFESFELSRVRVRAEGETLQPVGLGMDPYGGVLSYEGPCLILDPRRPSTWPEGESIAGKAVVTARIDDASLHFRLAAAGPRFIVYLSPSELLRLLRQGTRTVSIGVEGSLEEGVSSNVIAHLGAPLPAPQIVLGAHMDAYRECPGANDNASGVGALLELARFFQTLGTHPGWGLSFIGFGAEELGVLGSRRYVATHAGELDSLMLVLALDNLGGPGPVAVERTGAESALPEKTSLDVVPAPYRGRAWEGLTFPWILLPDPELGLLETLGQSYRPAWLADSIDTAVQDLGSEVTLTGVQGTDQMPFGAAGVPTSALGAVNRVAHTGGDEVGSVQWDTLSSAAALAARIVLNLMERCGAPDGTAPLPDCRR